MVILLSIFDFAHVKMSNPMDLVVLVNDSWGLPLSLRQCQIYEILQSRKHHQLHQLSSEAVNFFLVQERYTPYTPCNPAF